MSLAAKSAMLAVPLLLILLTAIAGYAYSQIVNLHLPISPALGLLSIILPLITGLSTRLTQNLVLRSTKNEQSQLTIPVLFILGFQLIYETIIVTLAFTDIIPPSSLDCRLKEKWQAMFIAKNENAIRGIQDRFGCCGLITSKNQAWPFPDKKHTAAACEETFGRTKSCLGEWKQAQQVNAGLFLLVAVVVFFVTLTGVLFLMTGSSWSQNQSWIKTLQYQNGGRREDVSNRTMPRRLIHGGENVTEEDAYRDDAERVAGVDGREDTGSRVQPSAFGAGTAESERVWGERGTAGVAGAA